MLRRRLPRTSYGYEPPREARARGWCCHGCRKSDDPAPARWPHPCPDCGRPTDPMFEEPWHHQAERYRIQHNLHGPDELLRTLAGQEQVEWQYRDAWYRSDEREMADIWHRCGSSMSFSMLRLLALSDQIGLAAQTLLERYPGIRTVDVEEDNDQRTDARRFVSDCLMVLTRPASIGHQHEAALLAAVRDVAGRIEGVLMSHHEDGFRQVGEMRALRRSQAALHAARARLDGLPAIGVPAADAALRALDDHDDTGPLDGLLGAADLPADLRQLLLARRFLALGDTERAMAELREAAALPPSRFHPHVQAVLARVLVLSGDARLDEAIAACRAGGSGGRRVTPADTTLARLLCRRALRGDRPAADLDDAVRLARRRCRPWRSPGSDDRVVLQDALAAREALTGDTDLDARRKAFRRSVASASSVAHQARLSVAWTDWAVSTGDAEAAAEAYEQLVGLVPHDVAARQVAGAKERVLAAAQEHTEEAGYWLSRTRRYREAVVALETGRAVGLSEAVGGRLSTPISYASIGATTGDGAVVYLAAAKSGGYALIVAADHDPQFVALPGLDRATVAGLVGSPAARSDAARDLDAATASDHEPADNAVLNRLWVNGIRNLVWQYARGRVVTLIPVGLLSLLPIHAAQAAAPPGRPAAEAWHAAGFSALRYAPNARALRRCQESAASIAPDRLLTVDVPYSSGAPLHHVARETAAIARYWPAVTALRRCTWAQFLAAADDHPTWHLACHGAARPYDILSSRLSFADRDVTLAELRHDLRPGRRRLAILSACESHLSGAALPNEAIGLPSALLELGFAGVIASSWKVDDLATAYLMTAFHQQWRSAGHEPAIALNRAQQWLRGATHADLTALLPGTEPAPSYADPRYWAAFAYTGA